MKILNINYENKIILVALLFVITVYPQITVYEEIVDDGVVYTKIINTLDTLSINILEIDIANNNYD